MAVGRNGQALPQVAHSWLIISAVTSLMLLINPYLTMRLMDDVIVAQNPEPLVGLLLTMLIVKVVREGLRYLRLSCWSIPPRTR